MTRPGKIICVGKNYRDHAREMGGDVPAEPLLFFKPPTSIIADGVPIELPPGAGRVDHEGEIGVVVNRALRRADEATARAAIGAVVAANDVSARVWQKSDGQWARAKGCDTFLPLGNAAEPPPNLDSLTVVARVNGVEKQRATAADMVFSIPFLLAYASRYMTLEPGDLMITGTPAGVSELRAGDVVEVEIVGVSRVSNPVVAGH
jgi:2-keto-4-pentenoate hydratase/2-oxohepta-3-ene-1,7-dioic acid hydratase in catechol pathway